jgi:hypothetical protein
MEFKNDEEVLDFMTRLLERLHQAGFDQPGSHYQFVYVASQPQAETHPCPPCLGREKRAESSATTLYPAPDPAPERGGELVVEERIRRCIGLLMAERYGNEPLFNLQGHWQAVYRILVDKGYCRDSDFDGFDAFIRQVMPEKVNKPYKKESVKQISKTDFALPFDRWHYDPQTSTTRKPYDRMVAVARRFKAILEENGL